jgi:hypothetical protein
MIPFDIASYLDRSNPLTFKMNAIAHKVCKTLICRHCALMESTIPALSVKRTMDPLNNSCQLANPH